jgi:outer membrane beta-barrel protein
MSAAGIPVRTHRWLVGAALWLGVAIGFSARAGAEAPPVPAESETSSPAATTDGTAPATDAVAPAATPAGEAADLSAAPPVTMSAKLASTRKVRLSGSSRNVVRTGPGDRYAIAGVFPGKSTFPVIAKSGDWYNIRLSETETGWVHSSLCKEFDDMADLEYRPNPRLFTRTGSYVLSGYTGAYAFDRKSNSLVAGGRLGYYVFDRLQVEGNAAWTHVRRPAEIVESLFGLTLEAEDFHMVFYHLSATFELMPGRQMVPFISTGVGSSIMQGDTETSFNFGAGTWLFLSKHTAMRWEVRNHQFKFGSDTSRRTNNNIEFTLGSAVLF